MFLQVQVEAKLFRQNGFPHKGTHFHLYGLNAYLLQVQKKLSSMLEVEEKNLPI